MAKIRITGIRKDSGNHENPHVAISHLRYQDNAGKVDIVTRLAIYNFLKEGGQAYVQDVYGNIAYVGTAETTLGTKYVRTYADGKWTDNLLSLPEC